MADLVGEPTAHPGDDSLIAEEPVEPHRVLAQQATEHRSVDLVGVGPEAQDRLLGLQVTAHHPDPRLALGAGLGAREATSTIRSGLQAGMARPRVPADRPVEGSWSPPVEVSVDVDIGSG